MSERRPSTPADVVKKLNGAANEALKAPGVDTHMASVHDAGRV
jgi:hypothetical protein